MVWLPYVLGESGSLETNRFEDDVYRVRILSAWLMRCGAIRLDLSSTNNGAHFAVTTHPL
jgi:hypothetical protein